MTGVLSNISGILLGIPMTLRISFEHVPKNREEPKLLEADDGLSDASKCLKARVSGKSSKFGWPALGTWRFQPFRALTRSFFPMRADLTCMRKCSGKAPLVWIPWGVLWTVAQFLHFWTVMNRAVGDLSSRFNFTIANLSSPLGSYLVAYTTARQSGWHLVHPSFLSGPTIVIPDPICWSYNWR
jgi:hypothetical protein